MTQTNVLLRSLVLTGVGALLITAGVYFQGRSGFASQSDRHGCEHLVQKNYGDSDDVKTTLLPRCSEPGMVTTIVAKANGAAAEAVSSANNAESGSNILCSLFTGIGIIAAAGGMTGIVRVSSLS